MPGIMLLTFIFVLGKPGKVLPSEDEVDRINRPVEDTALLPKEEKRKSKIHFINKQEKGT